MKTLISTCKSRAMMEGANHSTREGKGEEENELYKISTFKKKKWGLKKWSISERSEGGGDLLKGGPNKKLKS